MLLLTLALFAPGADRSLPPGRAAALFHHHPLTATGADTGRVTITDESGDSAPRHTEPVGAYPTDACRQDPSSMSDGGQMIQRWCGAQPEWLTDVAVSPDDRWVVATGIAGSLAVWDSQTLVRRTLDAEGIRPSRLEAADFSPDGRYLAVAGDYGEYAVRIYDTQSAHRWTLGQCDEIYRKWGMEVNFSPDGTQLAIGYWGGEVELRSFPEGRLLWRHTPTVANWAAPVQFTPDGRSILVFEPDSVRIFDAESGVPSLGWPTGRLEDLDLTRDGRRIVGRIGNHTMAIWDLPSEKAQQRRGRGSLPRMRSPK